VTTFFGDAEAAGGGEFVDTAEVGIRFTLPAGTINSLRVWWPAVAPGGAPVMHLWDGAGTLLQTISFDTTALSGWNNATPASPIAVTAGTYYVSWGTTRYKAILGFFSGGSVTRGSIIAVEGRFSTTLGAFPSSTSSAAYVADIDFTASGGGSTVNGTASITGAGTVTAAAVQGAAASASGAGSVTAAVTLRGSTTVSGTGSASAAVRQQAGATIAGTGSVTASSGGSVSGTASVSGAGTVAAAGSIRGSASAAGAGSVSAGVQQRVIATISGAGQVTAAAVAVINGTATVAGSGFVAASSANRTTPRPNAGTTTRPFAGITARP
jgi:hypothetical protein